MEALQGNSSKFPERENWSDDILMIERVETADNGANMKNTNPKTPDKSMKIAEALFLALEWE